METRAFTRRTIVLLAVMLQLGGGVAIAKSPFTSYESSHARESAKAARKAEARERKRQGLGTKPRKVPRMRSYHDEPSDFGEHLDGTKRERREQGGY